MNLDLNDLNVETFATTSTYSSQDGFCCTGCVSGCGINPTAGGCESSDDANNAL